MGSRARHGFFRAAGGDAGDSTDSTKPKQLTAAAGAEGSRAGWWMRAVYAIATGYCAGDLDRAVWEFDFTLYLALQPAALEAAGQLPDSEHYAIKEGLAAAAECKRQRRAARAPLH